MCCFRLGDTDKGIQTLEQQFRKMQTGLLYQTLGYLYIEKYDRAHEPDWAALAAAEQEAPAAGEEEAAPPAGEQDADGGNDGEAAPAMSPEEAWNAGIEKTEKFIRDSVEYDEEDSICLDNMGQFLYRVRGDKAAAREWFDRAIALKDTQIDTLWFLSRYDEEAGDRKAAAAKLEKALGSRFSPLNYAQKETVQRELARLKGEG